MSRLFGWSLPPGVSTLPGDEPDPPLPCEPGWPRCACGALLKMEPENIPGAPETSTCPVHGDDGSAECEAEEPVKGCQGWYTAQYLYRQCRKCSAITREEVW